MSLYKKGSVDYFFWHWEENPRPFNDFSGFLSAYKKDLSFIMKKYIKLLREENQVLPITHINELLIYLFLGKIRNSSACAVEQNRNYDILGGKIYPCADLPADYPIGYIDERGDPNIRDTD